MIKKILLPALTHFISFTLFAQVNLLDASTLPDSLKEDAHSVKREEKYFFEIKDIDEARLSVHQIFTVLDAGGDDVLFFYEFSDEFRRLEDAEIKVYDARGKLLNKYKKREMHAEGTGEGLVRDGTVYYFRVAAPAYPVTVTYDYEVKYKGTLNYPDYQIAFPEQAVENSKYVASVPAEIDLRFKAKNIDLTPVITSVGKNKFYSWEVRNLRAINQEEGAARGGSMYPQVMIAPNRFSMDDNKGDFTSWQSFGKWYGGLSKGSMNLTEVTKNFLKNMTKDAADDKGKMKIIYDYLQKNFRYVSIQLGIGGYKPFEASFVDQKKYGDCKALSNYTQACLDAIGIKSYSALINAEYNREPVDPTFPHNDFNHVILCIPTNKDTTWLECTSNTNEFGILGSFTENRNALLITPEGGVLVSTPKSSATENLFSVFTTITLRKDASGISETTFATTGEYKQDLINYVFNQKKDNQTKFLINYMGFLQPDDYEVTGNKKEDVAEMSFKMYLDKVPDFTAGTKMFLHPRIYKMYNLKLPDNANRSRPYYFECPYIKTDTTVYKLPDDYMVENLPQPRNNSFEYGSFRTSYSFNEVENIVTSIATLSLSQNVIPAEKYAATRKFFSSVINEYTEKIIIKKK